MPDRAALLTAPAPPGRLTAGRALGVVLPSGPGAPLAAVFSDDVPNANLASMLTFSVSAVTWASSSPTRARSTGFSAANRSASARPYSACERHHVASSPPGCSRPFDVIPASRHDHHACVQLSANGASRRTFGGTDLRDHRTPTRVDCNRQPPEQSAALIRDRLMSFFAPSTE